MTPLDYRANSGPDRVRRIGAHMKYLFGKDCRTRTAIQVSIVAVVVLMCSTLGALPVGIAGATTGAPTWIEQNTASSPSGGWGSLVFDPDTEQLVLFGAQVSTGPLADTWNWNGSNWTQLHPAASPLPRYAESMAYDPATHQLLMFGGFTFGYGPFGALGDTWTWSGSTWTQLSPATSPPARYGASMTFDAATGQLLLFGGVNGSDFNDTWTWSGSTWTQLSPATSPPARDNASMAFDSATSQLVLFGGAHSSGDLGDTWTWDGSNWDSVTPSTSPPARAISPLVFDSSTNQLMLYGGSTPAGYLGDTWTWDGSTWTEQSPTASPAARSVAYMADDPGTHQVVISAGYGNSGFVYDTWIYATAPGAPDVGAATASFGQASVSFAPPTLSGGVPTTQYTVTARDLTNPARGNQQASGASSPISVAGLTAGDAYFFTVVATNVVGTGPSSATSNPVTPPLIAVATTTMPSGQAGFTYFGSLAAEGGNPPYRWKITSGSLPKGFKLNKLTGVISGKTKQVGTLNFTVEVLDTKVKVKGHPATQNTATQALSIAIAP